MTGKKPRKGGRPTYTPETAQRRASGQIAVRIPPETAARLRERAAEHPGGLSGLVASLDTDPAEDRAAHAGLLELLDRGPVLLTLDRGDVVLRLLREPVPPCGVVAQGAGPGLHEALVGLRER
jgi:hypothetical protein